MPRASRDSYDAVVVGAGPAGSIAALRLAKSGARVLIAEKRPRIGVPVRCAEATGNREEIGQFVEIDESWITAEIGAARFISPSGRVFEKPFPGIGVMVDRERFDAGLAGAAERAGAELRTELEVIGLTRCNGNGWNVQFRENERPWEGKVRLVVGADGVESLVGRWAGLQSGWKASELYSCLETRIRSERRPGDGCLEFHFGREIAPGGYGWVFPRGDGIWNVGVGVDPSLAERRPARIFLDRLLERVDRDAERLATIAGAACRSRSLKRIAGAGVLLAGDAAHQGNPLTGGGIMNALEGGDLAGRIGAEALSADDLSARRLGRYTDEWARTVGKANDRYLRLADLFYRDYDDEKMEKVWDGVITLFGERTERSVSASLLRGSIALPGDFIRAVLPIALNLSNRRSLF